MTWALILLVSIGGLSNDESNAVASVPGFSSREQCERAAATVRAGLAPGRKVVHAVCVEHGKAP